MRILSWNLNGITACIERNDFAQIESLFPIDVICLQETHAKMHYHIFPQYHHYWFPAQRNNYSGTMIMTLVEPRNVFYGFGIPGLDDEGRVLTVDLGDIYVVNTYVPNSSGRFDRQEYRRNWDRVYEAFLLHLAEEKPVVACGDFNATMAANDIFAGNSRMNEAEKGYISDERSDLHRLVDAGFCDAYRELYPETSDSTTWTWWSNRLNKRSENRGWRLDYFFVDNRISNRIIDVTHHQEITGSDHCPIVLEANFDTPGYHRRLELQEEYNDRHACDTRKVSQRWSNRVSHFKQYEQELKDIQAEITVYTNLHQNEKVRQLQQSIMDNMHFKCLAVERVARSGAPCGVDNVKWATNADKLAAVDDLDWREYKASPQRIIEIKSKSTGKVRRSGILTYKDKAMSILCGYTFKPVEEAYADKCSFAFRPGRSRQDAALAFAHLFSGKDAPQYYIYVDIKGFYANIQHRWIMEHVPIQKEVLQEFLKAGHIFAGELFPAGESGISEGSPLSPDIANFTLDGMQRAIYMGLYDRTYSIDYKNGAMVRYADDVIVAIRSTEYVPMVLDAIKTFITPRGLIFSEEKSKIGKITDGLTIIGFTLQKGEYSITIKPSEKAVDRFKCEMHDYILNFRRSQRELIAGINKKLSGWAGQYKFSDAYESFRAIDAAVQESLLESATGHHPNLQRKKLIDRYWYFDTHGRAWYSLPGDRSVRVIHLTDAVFFAPNRADSSINPYFEPSYFKKKKQDDEIQHITEKYRPVWDRTGGKCLYCGRPILQSQDKCLVTVDPAKMPSLKNSAYAHAICTQSDFQFLQTLEDIDGLTEYDVYGLLDQISKDGKIIKGRGLKESWKYYNLYKYFNQCNQHVVTLTFDEIEKIIGASLPPSVRESTSAWYSTSVPHGRRFADAWTFNEYTMRKVSLKNQKVTFEAVYQDAEHVEIPDAIAIGKVPKEAKYEIEHFLASMVKKYNLTADTLIPTKPKKTLSPEEHDLAK